MSTLWHRLRVQSRRPRLLVYRPAAAADQRRYLHEELPVSTMPGRARTTIRSHSRAITVVVCKIKTQQQLA